MALLGAFGCAKRPTYTASDHYDGTSFHNPTRAARPGFGRVMRHVVAGRRGAWPRKRVATSEVAQLGTSPGEGAVAVTFINHATVLLEFEGVTVLTDPVWSQRVGPGSFAGPKRARDPGVAFEDLPAIDVVVISHNHYDHLDLPTLRRLDERDAPEMLVPLGDRSWMTRRGLTNVVEMDWWERRDVGGLKITFTPAQHNSGRGASDYNASLWGGYTFEASGDAVFFAGDTAYAEHFTEIRARIGAIGLALLPIGAYMPRDFTQAFHMDPAEAVHAQQDLQAPLAIGIHYGTFELTAEDFDAPPKALADALKASAQPASTFVALPEGQTRLVNLRPVSP
ncbi:MAG: MBL fold metallo-hydrolase [Myxococcota bacterium]